MIDDDPDDGGEEQLELLPLDYAHAFEKPREGHDGERVYHELWVAAMMDIRVDYAGEEERPIDAVLENFGWKATQRHASILATAACWLGCNFGQGLIYNAERERDAGKWEARHCYLLAWTIENRRVRGINHSVRVVEYMLADRELRRIPRGWLDAGLSALPALSLEDVEVVEHLMIWLAAPAGQRYLERCKARLEGIRHEQRLLRAAENAAAIAALRQE